MTSGFAAAAVFFYYYSVKQNTHIKIPRCKIAVKKLDTLGLETQVCQESREEREMMAAHPDHQHQSTSNQEGEAVVIYLE